MRNEGRWIRGDMIGIEKGEISRRLRGWEFRMGWWEREGVTARRWGLESRRHRDEEGVNARERKEAKRFRDLSRDGIKGGVSISWPLERGCYDAMNIVEEDGDERE